MKPNTLKKLSASLAVGLCLVASAFAGASGGETVAQRMSFPATPWGQTITEDYATLEEAVAAACAAKKMDTDNRRDEVVYLMKSYTLSEELLIDAPVDLAFNGAPKKRITLQGTLKITAPMEIAANAYSTIDGGTGPAVIVDLDDSAGKFHLDSITVQSQVSAVKVLNGQADITAKMSTASADLPVIYADGPETEVTVRSGATENMCEIESSAAAVEARNGAWVQIGSANGQGIPVSGTLAGNVVVVEGRYDRDVSDFLAADLVMSQDGNDWIPVQMGHDSDYAASVGAHRYATLQAALNGTGSDDGKIVTLNADAGGAEAWFHVHESLTLDFGEHTVTGHFEVANGTLTLGSDSSEHLLGSGVSLSNAHAAVCLEPGAHTSVSGSGTATVSTAAQLDCLEATFCGKLKLAPDFAHGQVPESAHFRLVAGSGEKTYRFDGEALKAANLFGGTFTPVTLPGDQGNYLCYHYDFGIDGMRITEENGEHLLEVTALLQENGQDVSRALEGCVPVLLADNVSVELKEPAAFGSDGRAVLRTVWNADVPGRTTEYTVKAVLPSP